MKPRLPWGRSHAGVTHAAPEPPSSISVSNAWLFVMLCVRCGASVWREHRPRGAGRVQGTVMGARGTLGGGTRALITVPAWVAGGDRGARGRCCSSWAGQAGVATAKDEEGPTKSVQGPWEHSPQSTSPSIPITSSQSSHVCQPHLCLQTPFLGLLLLQGPSPGVHSARSLPVLWPCPAARPRPSVGARGWMCRCWWRVPDGAVWDEELLLWGHHGGLGMGTGYVGACATPWCWSGGAGEYRDFQASVFHWPLTLQPSIIGLFSAPRHGSPGSCCPQAWAVLPAGPDSAQPGAGLPPAPLLHTGTCGWGLEALGLSPVVVPGAALVAPTPLQARAAAFIHLLLLCATSP